MIDWKQAEKDLQQRAKDGVCVVCGGEDATKVCDDCKYGYCDDCYDEHIIADGCELTPKQTRLK